MQLTTVFRHRVTTTECAGSRVDVGLQTSEQTSNLADQLSRRFSLGAQFVGSLNISRTL